MEVPMLKDQFLIDLKQKYIDTICEYNQDTSVETQQRDFPTKVGTVEVNVMRGKVFEKACVSTIFATVTIPGRDYQSTIQWLGVQTFPKNPLAPLFMGVFEHVSEIGKEHTPGYYDIYPTVPFDDDKAFAQKEMAAAAKKHGRSYEDLAEGYKRMFQVKEVGAGVGYGVGMAFRPEEEDFECFHDAASSIFKVYFHLVDKRKDEKPTPEQIEMMFKQRIEWVRFNFMENRFFQGGIQFGVPAESFMLHNLPPIVKF
jgi:coproporphyrinogen III oxidase